MCSIDDWNGEPFFAQTPEPPVTADHTPEMPDFGCEECGVAGGHYPLCSRRKPTADHTLERLSAEEREAICRAGFSTHDHLLQRDPAIAAFEAILAARLADVGAQLAAVKAALTAEGQNDATRARTARAALHPDDPSEPTANRGERDAG